jgi:hypothetical protein
VQADGKGLREELIKNEIQVYLLARLIIGVVILGVVDVADIERDIVSRLRIQIGKREI